MMVLRANSFDNGTDGATVTSANSADSGDAFTAVSTTLSYSSSAALHGALGSRTDSSATAGNVRCAVNSATARARIYFKVGTLPSTDLHLIQFVNGASRVVSVHINGANHLRVSDATGTTGVWTATDAISADTWYCLDLLAHSGTASNNGTISFAYHSSDGTEIESYSSTALNTGAGVTYSDIRLGKYSSVSTVVDMDTVAWDNTGTARIGPHVGTITGTPADDGPYWMVDATALTGGAGELSHSILPATGVTESPEGVFWVPQSTSSVDYTVTSTDGVTPVDNIVSVPAAGATDTLRRRVWTGAEWD